MNTFIFDLDGTLLNTLADIANAANATLKKHCYPTHPVQAYRQMVGNGFTILMKRALPPDIDSSKLEELVSDARREYSQCMMVQTAPYPGMTDTLHKLANAGAKLAVLSNKPDKASTELISHYFPDIPFLFVLGAIEGIPLKPNPQSLLANMQKFALSPDSTLYVGDSNVDVATAHNAGIKVAGAAWGFRGREELQNAGADIIIEHPGDLCSLL